MFKLHEICKLILIYLTVNVMHCVIVIIIIIIIIMMSVL